MAPGATIATALFVLLLSFLAGFGAAPAAARETTSLRIGGPVERLATNRAPFLVPIHFRHDGGSSAVHIGLDYDELMLHFTEGWSIRGAAGEAPWEIIHHEDTGYLEVLVPFDPDGSGRDSEALLIELEFELRDVGEAAPAGYSARESARLDFNDLDTYFLRSRDQSKVRPSAALDGGVTVYFRDLLEIGSARMTADQTQFRIPVFVTHLKQENLVFFMGLDYDELFLDLVGVEPVSELLDDSNLRYDRKLGPSQRAWVEVPFTRGVYPAVLRHHLLDLVFEYRLDDVVPPDDVLRIVPILGSSSINRDNGDLTAQVHEGTIYFVLPEFLRGDANTSGSVELNDAMSILGYCMMPGTSDESSPSCLDAMDADASGNVEITDAILVLSYLFLGGSPPEMPFPEPGPSPPGLPRLRCHNQDSHFELLPLPDEH